MLHDPANQDHVQVDRLLDSLENLEKSNSVLWQYLPSRFFHGFYNANNRLGLKTDELVSLEKKFTNLNLINTKQEHFFEVDTQGISVLNILCGDDYNYRITSQSMAMEKTNIGGRTIQVQKLVWTLSKQEV